ncbi:MAG: YD repeat-containing protein, partial [Desulfobacterales bacterium]
MNNPKPTIVQSSKLDRRLRLVVKHYRETSRKLRHRNLTLPTCIILLLFLFIVPANAAIDFKEIKAISAAIESIRLEGQTAFFLPPGTDGQLIAKTYPENLTAKVKWEIIRQDGYVDVQLDRGTGLLTVTPNSGNGWIMVRASVEGCKPLEKRIDIDCECSEEYGPCDNTVSVGNVLNGSVDVRLSLGKGDGGRSAGDLFLFAEEPLTILSTPEALVVNSSSKQVIPHFREGMLEQIITPLAIVTFLRFSPLRYEIYFYDIGYRGRKLDDGSYSIDPKAVPMAVWRIENPDETGETINNLAITEIRDGAAREFYYSYEAEEKNWTLTSGNGLKIESKSERINDAGDRVVRTSIAGSDGDPLKVTETVFRNYEFGEKRIRETVDPDGVKLATEYRYLTDMGRGYGKLAARINPDGGWVRYEYDEDGRIIREVRPFL